MKKKGKSGDIDKFLGKKLKAFRLRAKLSQAQLASQLNISFQQIQKYEKGQDRLSAATLFELCKVFGISANDFYEGLGLIKNETLLWFMDRKTIELIKTIQGIKDPQVKRALLKFIKGFALSNVN